MITPNDLIFFFFFVIVFNINLLWNLFLTMILIEVGPRVIYSWEHKLCKHVLSQVEKFIPEPISREGGAVGFSLPVSLQRLQNKQNS